MARVLKTKKKKTKKNQPLGRDAHGDPVSLRSAGTNRSDFADARKLEQRQGEVHKASMAKDRESARGRRPK
jgi:hypothetical protein